MVMNFKDIANKKLDDVERPPLIPVGNYIWQITKQPVMETLKNDKWDVVDFHIKAIAAMDDVDADELAKFGGYGKAITRHRFMFNKEDEAEFNRSLYNLRRFLEEHVKCSTPDMSITQALSASVNGQFMADIKWKPDANDSELMFANIGRTAPV